MAMEEKDLETIRDDILFFIREKQNAKLLNILLSMHPSDIAELIQSLDDETARLYLFNLLDAELASNVILELDDFTREKLVEQLGRTRLTALVDEMDSDDATDFLAELSEEVAEEVLKSAEEEGVQEVRQLMKHKEDTAGGLMALEIVSVRDDSTVREAIQEIRKKAEEVEDVYNVYVVDRDGKLVGFLTLKDLILHPGDTPVAKVMHRDVHAVPVTMDQEEVANFARRYDLIAVPVVDEQGRLLGRITIDDIVDVMQEEAEEDIQRMAGLADDEELRETSVIKIARVRLPWLFTGLMGGLISATVLSFYQASLEKVLSLAFFVPVITAMGGNVGIQSSAIVVRGLATGEIDFKDIFKRLVKELKISFMNGAILAMVIFLVVRIGWHEQVGIALLVGGALLTVIFVASVIGTTVPLILKKLNIDPALATGPFITTSNDIVGLFIYLALASQFLEKI
ncbi:MAG: magnesium transporter [candidate division KSB1 bacterium]|nr:magnesium transporter [candidate division KSB1 bacterium]